jgi:hypothetical protein
MKTIKVMAILLAFVLSSPGILSQQTTSKTVKKEKSVKDKFPHVSIAPFGGAIFPLTKAMRDEFKPGGLAGMDVCYRLNREVGLYGKFSYMFMSSKITGAPIGSYLEFTAGPRYYFTHPKLKSNLFFEGGVGAYNFRQNSYSSQSDPAGNIIPQISSTRAGINGGFGASINLFQALDILAKANYHNIFTPNGSQGFMTVNGGLEFRFR